MNVDNGLQAPSRPFGGLTEGQPLPVAPTMACAMYRPHVCFVSMNIYPILVQSAGIEFAGGAEVQQVMLIRTLQGDGFRVSVLTADHGQPDVVDCDGVRIHRVAPPGTRGIKGLRFIHPHMTDVVAGLDQIDPDIVYFRVAGFRAAAAAWYARRRSKRFVYACASDMELQRKALWPATRREAVPFRMALRSAHGVLVQNIRQQQLLKDNFGKDGVIIPNCYSEPDANPAASDGHVLWVGTIKAIKSPERFIELARGQPAKNFTMVGGADIQSDAGQSYFRGIQEQAAGLRNLNFVGHVPFSEVGQYFDGASVFVNTSDTEGFPNTFLQAWIRGVPTVSFVRPEVTPGNTGTHVCSDLEAMRSRVQELTSCHESWRIASDACKAHFSKTHSAAVVVKTYRDFLRQLMSDTRARRA